MISLTCVEKLLSIYLFRAVTRITNIFDLKYVKYYLFINHLLLSQYAIQNRTKREIYCSYHSRE